MLGRKREQEPEVASTMTLESLIAEPKQQEVPQDEYAALCEELGVESLPLAMAWLKSFMAARNMPTYSVDRVHLFLYEKAIKERPNNTVFITWDPLRTVDAGNGAFTMRAPEGAPISFGGISGTKDSYTKPVPIEALRLVRDIEKERPDTFNFHVSDYRSTNPDPFLLASHRRLFGETVVLYHWDEPGFTG